MEVNVARALDRLLRHSYDTTTWNHDDKIYIALVFDRTLENWKEYVYEIQTWIDRTNIQQIREQDDNDVYLLLILCPNINPNIKPILLVVTFVVTPTPWSY